MDKRLFWIRKPKRNIIRINNSINLITATNKLLYQELNGHIWIDKNIFMKVNKNASKKKTNIFCIPTINPINTKLIFSQNFTKRYRDAFLY